ncbi:uncharacterized protein OCT59_010973 [Rhizophagus irregularis]|uniref:uncharacterized protein n=1 Tax=Rhizophagus irregularis TaxID=588596 RepID=UPI00331E47A7|nr:hypothetical protein OCT59_010973 [Rhizophagus irregularis]
MQKQNSEQKEFSDSDQSSSGSERRLSKSDQRFSKSDRRPSKFKQRFSKSDRSSLKPEQKSKSRQRTSTHQQSHKRTQKYFNVKDMPKSFKEALRREVFWIIKRISTKVMSALDFNTFSVIKTIVYDLIHTQHKYQHEEHLNKSRIMSFQDKQA